MLPPLLFSLSKTAFDCSKTGLEYLNLLVSVASLSDPSEVQSQTELPCSQVIQKPANANHFLSARGWQKWFVDLLMGHDAASKLAPVRTPRGSHFSPHVRPAVVDFAPQPQDKDVVLKLSLNIIACIHYQHFATHQSSEEIDPSIKGPLPSRPKPILSAHSLGACSRCTDPVPNMASLLMGARSACRFRIRHVPHGL